MWRLDDIAVFVAVVEHASFVRAAAHLQMPTSTVSRRITELESALQIQLLERTSRRLHVTERGQQLFDQCYPLVKDMRLQVETLAKHRDELTGKITLTAPNFLANSVLAAQLFGFLHAYPEIELELKLSNRLEDLIDEGIDLAIRIGPLRDSQFVAQHLFTSEYGLYAHRQYLQSHSPILRPADLADHDVMTLTHQKTQLTLRDKNKHEQTITTHSRIKCNDIETARQAALNGVSIACLPIVNTSESTDMKGLVRVLEQYTITPSRDVFAVYPSRKHLSTKTRILIDFLKRSGEAGRGHSSISAS